MASFRCYDNCDVIATLIITNFHLHLMQLWWKRFPNRCFGGLCSKLGGIDPKKPYGTTFERKVGKNRTRQIKIFKKLDIANLFHQYSNPFKKNSGKQKFSLGAFSCWYSQQAEHSLPCLQLYYFKSRRINMMFNEQAAVFFLSGLKSRDEIDRYE